MDTNVSPAPPRGNNPEPLPEVVDMQNRTTIPAAKGPFWGPADDPMSEAEIAAWVIVEVEALYAQVMSRELPEHVVDTEAATAWAKAQMAEILAPAEPVKFRPSPRPRKAAA